MWCNCNAMLGTNETSENYIISKTGGHVKVEEPDAREGSNCVLIMGLQSPAPRAEYKTPLIPKTHPKIHPESSPECKIRINYTKSIRKSGVSVYFRIFFVFSFRDLGCILEIRGVVYSVRGTGDRNNGGLAERNFIFQASEFLFNWRFRGPICRPH